MSKPTAQQGVLHLTVLGERWDTIAHAYYGDATGFGRIVQANPHVDISPALPAGLLLLIPLVDLSATPEALPTEELPPWKQ